MTVAETPINSYHNIDPEKIENRRDKILYHIGRMHNPSNADLSRVTGLPINCVTPRTNELVKSGLVKVGGTKPDVFTKVTVKWWTLTGDGEELFREISARYSGVAE